MLCRFWALQSACPGAAVVKATVMHNVMAPFLTTEQSQDASIWDVSSLPAVFVGARDERL